MCFDADSLPPIPVLSGAAVSHDDLVLTSADGTEFAAFSARPDGPIAALHAGDDKDIRREKTDALKPALTEAGVDHEIVVYEGAPHSFFDRKQEDFAAASEDAWTRTLGFIERLK